ncbi:MAG TPA: hypothetical protein VFN88_01435 [Caulobacteraceae bacterium]|nr:hypothetical protein [Caulobacteraceae bacterium]
MGEEVIQASRGKAIAMVVICAALAIMAPFMLAESKADDKLYGGVVLALALGGIILFGWRVARPRRLTIQPDGLLFRSGIGAPQLIPWRDMEEVFVWRVDTANMLAYRVKAGEGAALIESAKSIRSFGGGWPGAVEDIAARLEALRAAKT